jgi:hypothetical protein
MINEQRIVKDMEGSDRGLIFGPIPNFLGMTEDKHEQRRPAHLVSEPSSIYALLIVIYNIHRHL